MVGFARLVLLALGFAKLPCGRGSWTEGNTACATRATGGRSGLLSFLWLRPDGSPATVLVQSLWDLRSGQLLECALRTEPDVTRRYLELCGPEGLRHPLARASWDPRLRRELDALEARKGACKGTPARRAASATAAAPGGKRGGEARPRSRRGLTLPGTLWCGAGAAAEMPSELGKRGREGSGGGKAHGKETGPQRPQPPAPAQILRGSPVFVALKIKSGRFADSLHTPTRGGKGKKKTKNQARNV